MKYGSIKYFVHITKNIKNYTQTKIKIKYLTTTDTSRIELFYHLEL